MRRELLFGKSILTDDHETLAKAGTLAATQMLDMEGAASVDPEGNIWAFGKYQVLDPGWLGAGVVLLENLAFGETFPFGSEIPNPITIPNSVRIVLVGDFGTGDYGGAL